MNGVSPGRVVLFFLVAAAGCAVDLATKAWMFARLGLPNHQQEVVWWVWPEYFGFQTSLNQGALFGMGQGKAWLFAGASVVAAVAIFCLLFLAGWIRDRVLTFALASVMGGICGNLYDRLGLWWTPEAVGHPQYAVRDFILVRYRGWTWPNFNIADSLLVCGAGLLVLHAWLTPTVATTSETP